MHICPRDETRPFVTHAPAKAWVHGGSGPTAAAATAPPNADPSAQPHLPSLKQTATLPLVKPFSLKQHYVLKTQLEAQVKLHTHISQIQTRKLCTSILKKWPKFTSMMNSRSVLQVILILTPCRPGCGCIHKSICTPSFEPPLGNSLARAETNQDIIPRAN